jgi:hypothetical protein
MSRLVSRSIGHRGQSPAAANRQRSVHSSTGASVGLVERTPFKRGTETVVKLSREHQRTRRLEPARRIGPAERLRAAHAHAGGGYAREGVSKGGAAVPAVTSGAIRTASGARYRITVYTISATIRTSATRRSCSVPGPVELGDAIPSQFSSSAALVRAQQRLHHRRSSIGVNPRHGGMPFHDAAVTQGIRPMIGGYAGFLICSPGGAATAPVRATAADCPPQWRDFGLAQKPLAGC